MALTAAASTHNKVIMQELCTEEEKCTIVKKKPNTKFIVRTVPDSIEQMLLPLVLDIYKKGNTVLQNLQRFSISCSEFGE